MIKGSPLSTPFLEACMEHKSVPYVQIPLSGGSEGHFTLETLYILPGNLKINP